MGLLSIFKRQPDSRPAGRAATQDAGSLAAARTRARRRLIGATLLVLVGVIGFPLLFDTAPRPLPVDIPIEIPRKDSAPPLAAPPPKAEAPATAPALVGKLEPAAEPAPPPVAAPRPAEPAPTEKKPPEPAAAPKPDAEAARALAALEGRPATVASQAEAAGRFVVQVGAYSEAESARAARQRVEKLGLKTYTQVVETAAGKRIRVRIGPFGERTEADKAAAQLQKAGLPSAVLTL